MSAAMSTPSVSKALDGSKYTNSIEIPCQILSNVAQTLNCEIHTLMKPADGKYYLPRTHLMRLASQETVHRIIEEDKSIKDMLMGEKKAFEQQVKKKASKLLLLCVYARMDMRCLKHMLDRSLSDESLPLENRHCCHPPHCGAAFRDLLAKQGSFLAPVFDIAGEHKIMPSCFVLPIHFVANHDKIIDVENSETFGEGSYQSSDAEEQFFLRQRSLACCGSGAYSKVYRVRVDPDHHQLSEVSQCPYIFCQFSAKLLQDRNRVFALKIFKEQPQLDHQKFEQERKILNELRHLSSEHIVVHCVTWTQDQKFYILFPYAECNLREYMERKPFDTCLGNDIPWLLSQFCELVNAFRKIHNITEEPPFSTNQTSSSQRLQKSAWHHDVKPQNILYFPGSNGQQGTFKVADFGSGKVQTLRSGSANTNAPNGTVTYEPPEAQLGGGVTSRPYDVWSLGCVILEMLIWAILGFDSVKLFAEERRGRSFPDSEINILVDDAFWEWRNDVATLRHCVIRKLQFLSEMTSKEKKTKPLQEVVGLIPQMLDPNPRTRIVAVALWSRLDQIFRRKNGDCSPIEGG